jgi:hypothetical protein
VLPWIPAVTFFLIFVLTFFNWVGKYPDGIGVVTQNAWQAAFGYYSLDAAFDQMDQFEVAKDAPGFSVNSFFYLLAFVPIMVVTIAVVVVSILAVKMPPAIQNVWSWRFLAVGVLTLIPLFFLALQNLAGFPLEDKARTKIEEKNKGDKKAAGNNEINIKKVDIKEGQEIGAESLARTRIRSLVILLHFIATAGAFLAFWVERRGPSRPLPRFEMLW